MCKDLHFETLARVSELIRSRQISSVDVTRALLEKKAANITGWHGVL